ncbi:hypothetical protein [Mastigocoleus sp. MO_188.B34]|uniref:hypothetical protein n=1 Tax=Mastigocoleus sp. MO_188.B34 TaxID=3036635 RepID=UPI00261DA473|nr:hypothetical protein [Mastigocoleus sp. MO_188.B34]MDJ0695532.1 hypothetical protein [Mastigocoleus sp. MO_188.B34]
MSTIPNNQINIIQNIIQIAISTRHFNGDRHAPLQWRSVRTISMVNATIGEIIIKLAVSESMS